MSFVLPAALSETDLSTTEEESGWVGGSQSVSIRYGARAESRETISGHLQVSLFADRVYVK